VIAEISGASKFLRSKRKPSTEYGIPVINYSRPRSDRQPPEAGPYDLREAEPWLDGVEVPLVERQRRPRVAPDIRADTYDDDPSAPPAADLFEPKWQPRRLLTMIASILVVALVAAFAVLALTFHAATTMTAQAPASNKDPEAEIADLQRQLDALANATGPATEAKITELKARLADLEAAKMPDGSSAELSARRTIATDVDADGNDKPAAAKSVVPVSAVTQTPAARAEPKVAAVPAARTKAGEGQPAGTAASDADFVASVEKALHNKRPDPKVSPPSVALAPADEEPKITAGVTPPARVNGAPASNAASNDIGPAVRVIPGSGASAYARPVLLAPRAAASVAPPSAVLDIRPAPGTPVPPEPIPNQ
jgi:hypothetical protein